MQLHTLQHSIGCFEASPVYTNSRVLWHERARPRSLKTACSEGHGKKHMAYLNYSTWVKSWNSWPTRHLLHAKVKTAPCRQTDNWWFNTDNLHTHNTITSRQVNKFAKGVEALSGRSREMLQNFQSHKNLLHSLSYTRMIPMYAKRATRFNLHTTADRPARINNTQYHRIIKASPTYTAQGIKPTIIFCLLYILWNH